MGIVSDVTGLVIAHGGNVGESVAGRLSSSYFSLMMLVSVPDENRDALQRDILAVPDLRSAVFVVDPNGASTAKPTPTIGCMYFFYGIVFALYCDILLLIFIFAKNSNATKIPVNFPLLGQTIRV